MMKEAKTFVAYSPALDLSTVGKTSEEAMARFQEAANIFFEEIIEKGTVGEALGDLGWRKINREYFPPLIVSHQTENFSIPPFQ